MTNRDVTDVALWRRMLAYWWFAWGQSACYWGLRTAERSLFRAGVNLFTLAIRVWPEFAGAYYRRGLIRSRELGEQREGIDDMTRVIALSPEWPEPYLQRGLIQRFHGDPRAALEDLQSYLSLGGELFWRLEAERQIAQLRAEIDPE